MNPGRQMNIAPLNSTAADLEEPDWTLLLPARKKGSEGMGAEWRERAHRHWLRIVAELRGADTLATANGHQIMRLVMSYCRYEFAMAKLSSAGAVVKSPRTQVPQHNLWRDEVRAADADATTAEMELGITPRRRGSVTKVAKRGGQGRAADAYLKPKAV